MQEEEEAPSEELVTPEPMPYIHRESRGRRSSYAFSHREGYADLITQGTSLRKPPGVNSDMLTEQKVPSDEELPPSFEELPWYSRRMSFLGRKRHQHRGKVSSEDMQPTTVVSSSFTVDGPSSPHLKNQLSLARSVAASTEWQSRSFQEKLPVKQGRSLSVGYWSFSLPKSLPLARKRPPSLQDMPLSLRENQLPLSGSQPPSSGQLSLESQPGAWEARKPLWSVSLPSLKSLEKELELPEEEELGPPPTDTSSTLVEVTPLSTEESSAYELPMEVEPGPEEGQPAVPSGDQVPPNRAEQPPLPEKDQ